MCVCVCVCVSACVCVWEGIHRKNTGEGYTKNSMLFLEFLASFLRTFLCFPNSP